MRDISPTPPSSWRWADGRSATWQHAIVEAVAETAFDKLKIKTA
jgi:hypothetical protein